MPAGDGLPVGFGDVERARRAVEEVADRTPVFGSRLLTESLGSPVVYKAENLQRTGSFKVRGVANKLDVLGEAARPGIVVASAGNHAQAAAFVASRRGINCEVFMPAEASVAKSEATIAYGATVHLGGADLGECIERALEHARRHGSVLVHPYDDPAIIAGQGTLGLELVEDVPDLALVVIPLGGGGLAGGTALAVKTLRPQVRVIAVQADKVAPFPPSLRAGSPLEVEKLSTLADGIAVNRPGELTLPLVAEFVDEVVTVAEDEIANAMVLLMERAKLVVEGAGSVGVAALMNGSVAAPERAGTTVVVLSGGNVDTGVLGPAIRRQETRAGRRLVLFARISDRPGNLARLLSQVASSGANIVDVVHLREGFDLHIRETGVHLVLETRNRAHAAVVLAEALEAGFNVQAVGHAYAGGQDA
ncbi:MAG TPA: threonine ammonia-lyase [Acidimicrobiales bacterium]|nr:threonine ammonia-lyase [Acidimicrobiales bacterium]